MLYRQFVYEFSWDVEDVNIFVYFGCRRAVSVFRHDKFLTDVSNLWTCFQQLSGHDAVQQVVVLFHVGDTLTVSKDDMLRNAISVAL